VKLALELYAAGCLIDGASPEKQSALGFGPGKGQRWVQQAEALVRDELLREEQAMRSSHIPAQVR